MDITDAHQLLSDIIQHFQQKADHHATECRKINESIKILQATLPAPAWPDSQGIQITATLPLTEDWVQQDTQKFILHLFSEEKKPITMHFIVEKLIDRGLSGTMTELRQFVRKTLHKLADEKKIVRVSIRTWRGLANV